MLGCVRNIHVAVVIQSGVETMEWSLTADTDITTVTSDAGTAILTWTGATGIQADLTVDTLQCEVEGGREGGGEGGWDRGRERESE